MTHFLKKIYLKLYIAAGLCGAILLVLAFGLVHQSPSPMKVVLATSKPTPKTSIVPTSTPIPTPIVDVVSDDSLYRIVNDDRPLDKGYVPSDLTLFTGVSEGQQYLRYEASLALEAMFNDAKKEGIDLYLISGYRSYETEEKVYAYWSQFYDTETLEMMDDQPGRSEHQLGLAVDIGKEDGTCRLDTCFEGTDAYAWLKQNAPSYGYIVRYDKTMEESTNILYAPWAFRYVGKEMALKISASQKSMEDYFKS